MLSNLLFVFLSQSKNIASALGESKSSDKANLKFSASTPFATNTKMLLTIVKDSSRNLVVRKNGSVLTQASSTGLPVANGNFVANQFGGRSSNPDRDFDGIIYEFLLYEKECSASELNNIETHLRSEHGL